MPAMDFVPQRMKIERDEDLKSKLRTKMANYRKPAPIIVPAELA